MVHCFSHDLRTVSLTELREKSNEESSISRANGPKNGKRVSDKDWFWQEKVYLEPRQLKKPKEQEIRAARSTEHKRPENVHCTDKKSQKDH